MYDALLGLLKVVIATFGPIIGLILIGDGKKKKDWRTIGKGIGVLAIVIAAMLVLPGGFERWD